MNLVDEAINEVRSISHNIMPSALIRSGIVSAVRELVQRVNNSKTLAISLDTGEFPDRLNENTEIGIYRIVQEMVNNIIKHARATKASIVLSKSNGNLNIEVSDNGIGITQADIENSAGIGWKNIFSRTSALDGHIEVIKGEKIGSKMFLRIPV
jgi:signal transduction histidine kinase